jgi:hypothetical protein
MNDEKNLTRKIREVLDYGTGTLDRATADRLHAARQKALARQRVAVSGLSLAGIGHFATDTVLGHGRALLAAVALVVGVAGTYVWTHFEQAAEHEEVDSALLADDLPPAAFLDKGFQAWLDRSSPPSR